MESTTVVWMVGNLVCMKDGEQVCLALRLVEMTVDAGGVRSAEWVVQWDCWMADLMDF